mgnify:CR=1 FL=1
MQLQNTVGELRRNYKMSDNDIQDFVKQITDYSYVPFCMMMQFYMNPDSILTKEYSPYELSLMSGLTIEPKENQKGELMCDFDDTLIVGTGFASEWVKFIAAI